MTTHRRREVALAIGPGFGQDFLNYLMPEDIHYVLASDATVADYAHKLGHKVVDSVHVSQYLLSLHYPHILTRQDLTLIEHPINVHPGYLPAGRGMYPVFWAVFQEGPAGASVHRMQETVDCGELYARVCVPYTSSMTGGEVWAAVRRTEFSLALRIFKQIQRDALPRPSSSQQPLGPNRKLAEFLELRDNPPLSNMTEQQIRRLVLALTHPKFPLPSWVHDYSLP